MIALLGLAFAGSVQLETFDHVVARIPEVHPDADLGCPDCATRWAATAARLRPQAKKAKDADTLRPLLTELLNTLGASHNAVLGGSVQDVLPAPSERPVATGPWGHTGLSVATGATGLTVWRVEPGSPAEQAGIQPGQVVLSVDGEPVGPALTALFDALDPRLADLVGRAVMHDRLDGPIDAVVALGLPDRTVSVGRTLDGLYLAPVGGAVPDVRAVWADRSLPIPGTAASARFVRFDVFALPAMERFTTAMGRAQAEDEAVILDLRGNPGGVIQVGRGVAGFFASERGSLGVMRTRGADLDLVVHPRPLAQRFPGPLAILVDGASGSTSEILAAALQESGRARIFGVRTAGMALPSQFENLPNGDVLQLAIGDLATPGGQRVEAVGVTPDVLVPLAPGPSEDPVLTAALTWLSETIAPPVPSPPAPPG